MPADTQEAFVDLAFPLRGLDISLAFSVQRDGTTPTGENVVAWEPETGRARGGSRPGILRYLPQLPNGPHLIQNLNVVIDPQADALLGAADDMTGSIDPSSPGPPETWFPAATSRNTFRRIRVGGSAKRRGHKPASTVIAASRKLVRRYVQSNAGSSTAHWDTFTPGFNVWLTCFGSVPPTPSLTWRIMEYQWEALIDYSGPTLVHRNITASNELANGDIGIQCPLHFQQGIISAGGTEFVYGSSLVVGSIIVLETQSFPGGSYPAALPDVNIQRNACGEWNNNVP